jgi:CTP:molybdopterin cytidylyltransferase MocA
MIAGIVLAAGRSRRMGEPKALLRFAGATFLERAVRALAGGGCHEVWVVTGADPAVAEAAAALGARTVANPAADAEQIDSLRVALRALPPEAEAAAVALVDVPEVDAATVRAVLDGFRRTGAPVVLPAHGGRHGHPVLFARAAWAELLAPGLAEGARTVVHAHAADRVEVAVPALPRDVDTPDDYRRLLAGA